MERLMSTAVFAAGPAEWVHRLSYIGFEVSAGVILQCTSAGAGQRHLKNAGQEESYLQSSDRSTT